MQLAFPACDTVNSDACACGSDASLSAIVARPEFAFKVAVWWFAGGIAEDVGAPCTDLRTPADAGGGWSNPVPSRTYPGTAFHAVAECSARYSTSDALLSARVAAYVTARQLLDAAFAMPAQPHAACIAATASVTAEALEFVMGDSEDCPACSTHLAHINAALVEAGMNCPLRAAAYLAHVRTSTTSLTELSRESDNAAGAILLPPGMQRLACAAIPALASSMATNFPSCGTVSSDPCACGTDAQVAAIVKEPWFAHRIAAWFLSAGAEQVKAAVVVGVAWHGTTCYAHSLDVPCTNFRPLVHPVGTCVLMWTLAKVRCFPTPLTPPTRLLTSSSRPDDFRCCR